MRFESLGRGMEVRAPTQVRVTNYLPQPGATEPAYLRRDNDRNVTVCHMVRQ